MDKKAIWINSEAFLRIKQLSQEWGVNLGETIEYIIEDYDSMKESG